MKTTFNKTIISTITVLALSTSAFSTLATQQSYEALSHEQAQINQAVGLGSGVLIGALIAGPAGAAVAGIIGAFIGDDVNNTHKLADKQHALLVKQTELRDMQVAFQQLKQDNEAQLAAFDQAIEAHQKVQPSALTEVIANIQFKTASFLIEEQYKVQLDVVAEQLRSNPALKIRLSGFADQRGDSTYNQILSEQRNASVKDYLMRKWVDESQISSQAFGENHVHNSPEGKENHFFDRRVVMQVKIDPSVEMTAATDIDM